MWAGAVAQLVCVCALMRVPMQVHKHSLWSVFELKHENQLPLPPLTRVTPVRIFEESPAKKWLLFNEYKVSSTFFTGRRLEVCVIVRLKSTTHFVVLDCLSDTLRWDPIGGIQLPNSIANTERTFNRNGRVAVRACSGDRRARFAIKGNLCSTRRLLTPDFAVHPNRECFFSTHDEPFAMDFDEKEVLHPVHTLADVRVETTLWSKFCGSHAVSFVHPQSMHYNVNVPSFEQYAFRGENPPGPSPRR